MPNDHKKHGMPGKETVLITLVTPAFNEERNLESLHGHMCQVLDAAGLRWEWIVVDDCSLDGTFDKIRTLSEKDARIRGVKLARNVGSHSAIVCGIEHAKGSCAVVLAADLQDRPNLIPDMIDEWREGAQVVWAVRANRDGESALTLLPSRFYYWIMRNVVGLRTIPATGSDYFLLDRRVVNALKDYGERNLSLMALILWMGFRQKEIYYTKQSREHGQSGWTLKKKLKLLVDSVVAFSYLPLRVMSYLGFAVAVAGFVYAGIVVINALAGRPAEGWSSLMVVVLVIGGIQMLMMGVLGEYLWRALDETRKRPRYMISDTVNSGKEGDGI